MGMNALKPRDLWICATVGILTAIGLASVHAQRVVADPRTGVVVNCELDATLFPESWQIEPIKGEAVRLPDTEVKRATADVLEALSRYPEAVLKKNLKAVYVAQEIKFYGLPYGATNSNDALYLSDKGVCWGFTDQYLRGSVHHEFSSILLRNFPKNLDQKKWSKTLPADFHYRGDGTQSVREGTASTIYTEAYFKQGFLCEYATSSQEEDFNMLAEGLFTGKPEFWDGYDNHKLLKAKVDLVIAFYHAVDPSFTLEFFRRARVQTAA